MPDTKQLAQTFRELHRKDDPVILYNIWDLGSALAVKDSGAKAIATGSHGVANSFGYEDGEKIPLELALETAKRVVEAVDLPVSMDIETGYGDTAAEVAGTVRRVIETGVVGINFEDRLLGSQTVRDIAEQVERIRAVHEAIEASGTRIFFNSRTDLFLIADPEQHDSQLLEKALERSRAYHESGADGFFVPGIKNLDLIRELCSQSPLPVNIIKIPGTPTTAELIEAGVCRISYGPVPYLSMIEWLKENAKKALSGEE